MDFSVEYFSFQEYFFFQEGPLCDDARLHTICKSLSTVFTHRMDEGRTSVIFRLCCRAISHSAAVVDSGILSAEAAQAISIQSADTATKIIGVTIRWFGWYGVNNDVTEEERMEVVATVVEELHNLLVRVRPMLRRLGSLHPLISKMKDLKNLLVNNALTDNLEEKESCIALLDEVLSLGFSDDIYTVPKLTNGEKKICSLNAAFALFLKIFPDIRKNIKSTEPLSREIELVLNAAEETSLVLV